MKLFITLLSILFFSQISIAQVQNQNLECSTTFSGNQVGGVGIGCVSKASIERDKAQTRLLEIQIKIAEAQLRKIQKDEKAQAEKEMVRVVTPVQAKPTPTPTDEDKE